MVIRTRPTLPAGHGELLVQPPFAEWRGMLEENRRLSSDWAFTVAGRPVARVREEARQDALSAAEAFSARLGVDVRHVESPSAPIVMTGHQPELYHPGVWAKDFLLQRMSDEMGATAVDVVVDSDGFESLSVTAPCLAPNLQRCKQHMAVASAGSCYFCTPVPSYRDIEDFCSAGHRMLATLPAPSVRRHFEAFCSDLRSSAEDAENLAELVTFARRRYENAAGTDYLELPVTAMCRGEAFAAFVADIALDAERFASAFNAELAEYRTANRIRSAAQPFPDLAVEPDRVELPLWSLGGRKRATVWVQRSGEVVRLLNGEQTLIELSQDPEEAIAAVMRSSSLIAPKALTLTLFARVFCCDFFIHGIGGGRYDRVTDGVCRRYFSVDAPSFAVASLTMYLPLGAHVVSEDEVATAKERLNKLEHNPNALLSEVDFDTTAEREEADSLAAEKTRLVQAISEPGADRKALGARIREVNQSLGRLLEPLRSEYESKLSALQSQLELSDVLTDRTYPFCFWSPEEIADKTR